MIVSVGSTNPVKLACVEGAFAEYWPGAEVRSAAVESGVSHQPRTVAEAFQGALTRAARAMEASADSSYGAGLEGGVVEDEHGMWAYAWVVIMDRAGRVGKGQTARYLLPEGVAQLIRNGLELGEADDQFFGRVNSKHNEGAIGILSNGRIGRRELYRQAVTMALLPFVRRDCY